MRLRGIAVRNIFRNTRRSILSASAIAIAVLAMAFMFAFVAGMKTDMARQVQDWVSGQVRIQHPDYEKNERFSPLYLALDGAAARLEALDRHPDVSSAVARIAFPGLYFEGDEQVQLQGWALDFDREERHVGLKGFLTAGSIPQPGKREIVLGTEVAAKLGLKPGDSISILYRTARFSTNYMTFQISGLVSLPLSALNSKLFLVARNIIGPKLFLPDHATQILVKTSGPGDRADHVAQILGKQMAPLNDSGTVPEVRSWNHIPSLYSFMGMAELIYDFVALFFYLLASTVIISTTMMVVFERTREIGTLAALGMDQGEILKLFFLESFLIGLAGTLTGLLIAIAVVLPLSASGINLASLTSKIDFGVSAIIYPELGFRSLVLVPLGALAVAGIAGLVPARRALAVEPVEALRA